MTYRLTFLCATALIASSCLPAHAASYQLGYLDGQDGRAATAAGINDAGRVVGVSKSADGVKHATMWESGTPTVMTVTSTVYYGHPTAYYIEPKYDSYGAAINQSGQMVGRATVAYAGNVGSAHAMQWDGSTMTDITPYPTVNSYAVAFGLNDRNQIVGMSRAGSSANYHATLWNGSTAVDLGSLGGNSVANAINNRGKVVGNATVGLSPDQAPLQHAFSWSNGTMTDLGTLGGGNSDARAVNGSGLVAGYADTALDRHATVWNGTYAFDLSAANGNTLGIADSINNFGQVVGMSIFEPSDIFTHATLWNGTTALDLNTLVDPKDVQAGWILEEATGINDRGWIVGNAHNWQTDEYRGFLLSPFSETMVDYSYMFAAPVDEPPVLALFMAGLIWLTAYAGIKSKNPASDALITA